MNAREQARFDMVKRVGTFGTNNAADFNTPLAPAKDITAGQTQASQLFDDLNKPDTGFQPHRAPGESNKKPATIESK